MAWITIDKLINEHKRVAYDKLLWAETPKGDPERFASLKPVEATIAVDNTKSKKISDKLLGIFFEDINYAADGGLYAELIQNRVLNMHRKTRKTGTKTGIVQANGELKMERKRGFRNAIFGVIIKRQDWVILSIFSFAKI
ncbi:hypothetical protein MK137Hg34_000082400 [Viscerimonas tarda]